jgi:hypothetical protein
MELENNLDGELKVEAQEKGKMAVKVLDALVFSKFGGIEYSMIIRKTRAINYSTVSASIPFYFEFDIDVDVDKTFQPSPTYDKKYEEYIYEIGDHIGRALRYVNLQDYMDEPMFTYVNDELVDNEVDRLENKLILYLQSQYEGLSYDSIREADIGYYFYKGETDNPYMRVEYVGQPPLRDGDRKYSKDWNNIEEREYFSCEDLYDIMSDLFDRSPLSLSYDGENFTCQ